MDPSNIIMNIHWNIFKKIHKEKEKFCIIFQPGYERKRNFTLYFNRAMHETKILHYMSTGLCTKEKFYIKSQPPPLASDRTKVFNPINKRCGLCTKEKFYIIFKPEGATLNQRSELFSTCRHRLRKLLTDT